MDEQESLNHMKWECKYGVVFIPKCRRKTLYQELRRRLGEVLRWLAGQKEFSVGLSRSLARLSPVSELGGRAGSRGSARPLDVPFPIFKVRPLDAFGSTAKRIHLLRRQGLELLGEANVVL